MHRRFESFRKRLEHKNVTLGLQFIYKKVDKNKYLKDYDLKKGYMLSFNFNKKKEVGVKEFFFKDATIVEAIL